MFKWNDTFLSDSTNFFTNLPLQLFAKNHSDKSLKTTLDRRQLMTAIARYANQSPKNEEEVNNWIDDTMKEGKREVYVERYDNNPIIQNCLKNNEFVYGALEKRIMNPEHKHVNGNKYDGSYKLVKYSIDENQFGRIITLFLCKMVYCKDGTRNGSLSAQIYPVIVEFYVDSGYMLTSVKTKSNMLSYIPGVTDVQQLEVTSSEREANKAKDVATKYLQVGTNVDINVEALKYKLYSLLNECTQTPDEIKELLEINQDKINGITNTIMSSVCKLNDSYRQDVQWDVQNMVEKYFSMTYPDKNIFIRGRKAYPIKIDAMDQQASRVQQTSSMEEPLQSKDIFFDNKKMLQKNKSCENVKFSFERLNSLYCDARINVNISVNKRYCIIRFEKYTVREDIDNVLRSIIWND